ncbi:serine hydrolase [Paenibacillus sp. AR247]|uniref:serine hydrolase domain-containing protein n=1 Tax=Paenibacillus sp. AR247 TaxID=1631599 RepID=UPI002157484F|nr:serine hydrolase domain-containing protein [Paenibacillus sp. AR247]
MNEKLTNYLNGVFAPYDGVKSVSELKADLHSDFQPNGEAHVEAIGTMRHDGGAPMRRDTIFRMASTSKPVTMAAAMVLLDECRLRLDDVVDPWLPELADRRVLKRADGPLDDTVPARRPITVRDLLTSTFGLGMDMTSLGTPIMNSIFEQGLTPDLPEPMPEPDEWMRRLGALPLMHQPGERWQYHISNDLLGVLVARVTGQSFETFLRERIFDPLGMKDTSFHVPADKIDRLPPLYAPNPQTGEFNVWDEAEGGRYSQPPAFQGGGGGLCSTVDDYHAYFQMLLNQGMHGNQRILSRPAVQLMTTNRLTPEQQAARHAMATNNVHVSFGQGQHGGWGFGMAWVPKENVLDLITLPAIRMRYEAYLNFNGSVNYMEYVTATTSECQVKLQRNI